MHRILFLVTILVFSLAACKTGTTVKEEIKNENVSTAQDEQMQGIDPAILTKLYNECEAIEITFYHAPISMASNKSNTRSFLSFITREPVFKSQLRKKALGIMSYNVDGDIYIEAEFFIDQKDPNVKPYFKFIKDKKFYYNIMSAQGVNLLTQPLKGLEKK